MKKIIPGLLIAAIIAVAAGWVSKYVPAVEGVTWSIILGMAVGNIFGLGDKFGEGVKFAEKNVLTFAIVLMGFKLNLVELGGMGKGVFFVVLPTMAVTIFVGLLAGKAFGFSKRFSTLMGVGNAVCGASAIAAVAPAVEAEEEEIGVSIGIVNLLGTIGIFIVPLIAYALHFTDTKSSFMIGGVLQSIGQVVAAGFSVNENVGDAATLIKMLRVLMIGPVVILVSVFNKTTGKKRSIKQFIPAYIIGFVICSVIASVFNSDTTVLPYLKTAARMLLMVAMAGVGMKIRFRSLAADGPKALLFGSVIAIIQLVFVTAIVLACM